MSEIDQREKVKAEAASTLRQAHTTYRVSVPVVMNEQKCIAGCKICIDSCPVDCLAINPETGKAHMKFDECWYCLACEIDCPRDAITVQIPYLLR